MQLIYYSAFLNPYMTYIVCRTWIDLHCMPNMVRYRITKYNIQLLQAIINLYIHSILVFFTIFVIIFGINDKYV